MFILEQILLNILFIIVFLLFIPLLLELNPSKWIIQKKRWIINLSTMLAIICCITFPIPIMEGYIFDLRLVPLTIGGLYGGIPTILFLGGCTILYRFIVGGLGALASAIIITILTIILLLFSNYFRNSSNNKKILIGSFIALSITVIALFNSIFLFDATFSTLFTFLYICMTLGTTAFIIYLFEKLKGNIMINQRVMEAEKMEVVSHLASSVSHEVRNPLTTTRGFLQLMLQFDLPEEKRIQYLKISIDELDRANEIIRDYLTFAKPASEKVRQLNLREEVFRTLQIMTPLANMNSVEITTKLGDHFINGEDHTFQQALINMTKNCIEAMPHKGVLSIESMERHDKVLLTISDTGKGMTKDELSRIGEPYFTTKGREGTGLGMMVSKKIIESMNGTLDITSKLNHGTTFHISLPLANEKN
ncbi:ATP-binding protein [Evansella tamaricis]|uniref:Two-component sensor histidine kinase n=1 Tax=Evansella tamaricis TaxID=2069301 RepID=A0ABS6JGI6_9BACI|nr:ATP-binding protein [Evansella tamaricis]MBU9712638.1 two-component sensor histidine kinase [Evansella tamaricis]